MASPDLDPRDRDKEESPRGRHSPDRIRPDFVDRITEHPSQTDNLPERRIVLLGKTGVGKSASGNTILGSEEFQSEFSLSSVTSECQKGVSVVSGQRVSVIDTPGFFDTEMSEEDLAEEIGRSIYLSQPGAHAFLFVLRLNSQFTEQEDRFIQVMETAFGSGVKDHTIILFTHGEKLGDTNMEHEIKENPKLRNLMERFGGRYHIFSNNEKTNRDQVTELMEKIDRMLEKNNGKCYTSELYEAAQKPAEEQPIRERRQAAKRAAEGKCIREMSQAAEKLNIREIQATAPRSQAAKSLGSYFPAFSFREWRSLLIGTGIAAIVTLFAGSAVGVAVGAVGVAAVLRKLVRKKEKNNTD